MAKNAPYGDSQRIGAVKERSQTYWLTKIRFWVQIGLLKI
jgi:hypothetical protein